VTAVDQSKIYVTELFYLHYLYTTKERQYGIKCIQGESSDTVVSRVDCTSIRNENSENGEKGK